MAGRYVFAKTVRGHLEHKITCSVAQRVVDVLEAVQIDQQDGC